MRLTRFLNEEDMIKKAMELEEPEVNGDYDESEVAEILGILQIAIGRQTEIVDKLMDSDSDKLDAARNILKDLKDKYEKWSNWEEETKSQGPSPPGDGEIPPEEVPSEE